MKATNGTLAINGGPKAVTREPGDLFTWPIITPDDEAAVLDVLRSGDMSGNTVSKKFEQEFATWIGAKHALTYPNGTEAVRAAMWACGLAAGDEIICPSLTYWASAAQALSLGVSVNFADSDPNTLCIDPADVEHRIGSRTRAIVVVHYLGHPCDMDALLAIARRHNLKVIEDTSHAHGSLYKGRKCGTLGDVGAFSLMSGKSFPVGEGGMLVTNDRSIYENCIAYGFYERTGVPSNFNAPDAQITLEGLKPYIGVPMGGYKHRMNQTCAAMGRIQLKAFDARMHEIDTAMNRFWDLLEGVPGVRAVRPARDSGSTMGGWYASRGLYRSEELGGLSCDRFCEAVRAEGVTSCTPGANKPLHTHPLFHTADLFRQGKPTVLAFGQRDVRQGPGSLPVAENTPRTIFNNPWFKKDRPELIGEYAAAFRKVAEHAAELN